MDPMDAKAADGYRLARDNLASIRLNAQHYLWKSICGFNIHPNILSSLSKDNSHPKIADCATGTGIWLIDVHTSHPTFSLSGFDISLAQCPTPQQAPPNCTYQQLNMLDPVPQELRGAFDVVHVRLVLGALKDDPSVALRNFIEMLKPGGYLQWQELNKATMVVGALTPELKEGKTACGEVVEWLHGMPFGKWTERLAKICAEQGMIECRTDRYQLSPTLAVPFCQTQIGAFEEITRGAMDNETPESSGSKMRWVLGRASAELLEGLWVDHKLEVTVARKPL